MAITHKTRLSYTQTGSQAAHMVEIGSVTLFFSYNTLIGAMVPGKVVRIENQWGPTTGKHINGFGLRNAEIVESEELESFVMRELSSLGAEVNNGY